MERRKTMAGDIVSINIPVADAQSRNFLRQRDTMLGMIGEMKNSITTLSDAIVGEAGDSVQHIYPELEKVFKRSEELMNDMGVAVDKIRKNFIETDSGSKISM